MTKQMLTWNLHFQILNHDFKIIHRKSKIVDLKS